jgi:hypothetical protein
VEDEHGEPEIAFFELSREALPGALGISLYTSPDGDLQRRHLQDEQVLIVLKSHEDLLEAMSTGVPSSIYLDGERIAGSVFKAMLEIDLGIPLQRARSAMSSHSSGAGGTQRQERGRILLLIGLPRTRVNMGERKAGDPRGGPRHIMESDFAQAYPYAAMSPAMIPTIPTRIEHWPTSLIISGHESSSSLSLSLSSSTESISSISTDLICFSCVGGIVE